MPKKNSRSRRYKTKARKQKSKAAPDLAAYVKRAAKADLEMAGKIVIDIERCKGCGLCIVACPKKCIVISKKSNKIGYFPAVTDNADCTGCAACAVICPEAIIKVFRETKVASLDSDKKGKPNLIKEKA